MGCASGGLLSPIGIPSGQHQPTEFYGSPLALVREQAGTSWQPDFPQGVRVGQVQLEYPSAGREGCWARQFLPPSMLAAKGLLYFSFLCPKPHQTPCSASQPSQPLVPRHLLAQEPKASICCLTAWNCSEALQGLLLEVSLSVFYWAGADSPMASILSRNTPSSVPLRWLFPELQQLCS